MTDSSSDRSPPEQRFRVPIKRPLDAYSNDPDHVRGAKYANCVLDADLGQGDAVYIIYLDRVDPAFFTHVEDVHDLDPSSDPVYGEFKRDPDVICLPSLDELPDAFEVAGQSGGGR
jgi:DNA polymerase I